MKKVIILGAGFGGLAAAMRLGKKVKRGLAKSDMEVTLVDQNKYHTYTPILYETAATSKDVANYADLKSISSFSVKDSLKSLPVKFINEKILKIEMGREPNVRLESGYILKYDYLLVALGSITNFFGIPGLEENSFEIKTLNDSLKIRDAIWGEITSKEKSELKVVIGGGGSTGVEVAAEIKLWLRQLSAKHSRPVSVKIIEANETILKGFDDRVIKAATDRLKKIGVETLIGQRIMSVEREKQSGKPGVIKTMSGDKIEYDILIWAGGVTANKIVQETSMKLSSGRAEVGGGMLCLSQTPDLSFAQKVFAAGDIVCVMSKDGRPVPMVARAAIDQAKIAADNIERDIKSRPHKHYKPTEYPYVIAIGGKYAICKIGPVVFKGLAGWVCKGLVELNYLFSIMPKFRAIRLWLKGFFIFIKNDRLG